MPTARQFVLALSLLALAGPAARAQDGPVFLSGHYDNNQVYAVHYGDGYDTSTSRPHVVTPDATFSGNSGDGLRATTSALTVQGGAFKNNHSSGLVGFGGYVSAILGGDFTGNGYDGATFLSTPALFLGGGTFSGNAIDGLTTYGDFVNVTGGTFAGNGLVFAANGLDGGAFGGNGYGLYAGRGVAQVSGGTFVGNGGGAYLGGGTDTVSGGSFVGNALGLTLGDGAAATVSGGAFTGNVLGGLLAQHVTSLAVTGGDFSGNVGGNGLYADGGSPVSVSGGTFTGNGQGLVATGGSVVTVLGGDFSGNSQYGLVAAGGARVSVYGGDFSGSGFQSFAADRNSTITLYGTGLAFAAPPPDGPPVDPSAGTITGTLQNGLGPQTFSYRTYGGTVRLVNAAVPEPSPAALTTLGLGLLGLTLRARKRR